MENEARLDIDCEVKPSAVCISCRVIRLHYEWIGRKANEEEFRTLGRVICPKCGPKNNG